MIFKERSLHVDLQYRRFNKYFLSMKGDGSAMRSEFTRAYQPVLISSVGGREPSGDSGRSVLSARNVIILLTTWIITHDLMHYLLYSQLKAILCGKGPNEYTLSTFRPRTKTEYAQSHRRFSPSHTTMRTGWYHKTICIQL